MNYVKKGLGQFAILRWLDEKEGGGGVQKIYLGLPFLITETYFTPKNTYEII